MKVILRAFAKINLFLEILKKESNICLHNIETVVQSVSLYDEIKIEFVRDEAFSKNKIFIKTDCDELNKISYIDNSAYRACKEFLTYYGFTGVLVKIEINKNIPLNSGLGGESTDAAAILVGLNYLFRTNLDISELYDLAIRVGSDVLLCLIGGTLLYRKLGSSPKKMLNLPVCHLLICKPDFGILTKDAYKMFDDKYKIEEYKKVSISDIVNSINEQNIIGISNSLYNRFESVLENKTIKYIKKIMTKFGALSASMSGSGSAVFGIFKDYPNANMCKNELITKYSEVFICKPINRGQEIILDD